LWGSMCMVRSSNLLELGEFSSPSLCFIDVPMFVKNSGDAVACQGLGRYT
jgi:hypothetical protein